MDLGSIFKSNSNITIFKDFKLNVLGDQLKDFIKNKSDFFESTDIVFPSDSVAQWFKTYWLKTESDVLMNINFLNIDECLFKYLKTEKDYSLVNRKELRDLIIKNILLIDKVNLDAMVVSYIYDNDCINSIRLYDLANSLSKLFIDYEKDSFEFIGWQKDLYEKVMSELECQNISSFSYIYNKNSNFIANDRKIVFFGFNDLEKMYIEPIKKLSEANEIIFYLLSDGKNEIKNTSLMSAPSKTREIESIHSTICSLVNNENIKYSDILVLCPDTSKYEREINRVFNQDGQSFPNIPFCINDKKMRETDVTLGLKKLFEISTKNFYTRLDFSEIINNKIIQEAREISKDDIDNWQRSIIEMNVFRDGKNINDWKYAKKRLILSKVASINSLDDNIVSLKDAKYIPFSNIDFDDDSIIKFVSIVDDLNEWMTNFNNLQCVNDQNISLLKEQLIKWFSIKTVEDYENNLILLKLLSEINFWVNFGLTNNTIPLNTLFYTLFDISQETKINTSGLFVEGITFADYDESSLLSSKIMFFIGASSKEFPIIESKSEIDQRPENDKTNKQYINFELQCANATDKLYLSYINKNLKTDEDFFPSTLLIKLFEKNSLDIKNENTIGIDETRSWKELFTKKEYKEKDYYIGLFKNNEYELNETNNIIPETMKKVTVSQMKNYLSEPLKYKFEYLFGKADDTTEMINDQYEPIFLDSLTNFILIKSVLLYLLKHPESEIIDENGEVNIDLSKEIFERFIIEHKIPNINEEIQDINIESVVLTALETKNGIINITDNDYDIKKIPDFQFEYNDDNVVLIYNDEFCYSVIDGIRCYFELCESKFVTKSSPNFSYFLTMYVCSLMDISSLNDNDEYTVRLYKGAGSFYEYSIQPEDARKLILEIYKNMNTYEINSYMPLDFVKINKSFDKMIEDAMGNNGTWRYFKDRHMFNPEKDLGYNRYNYVEKSTEIKNLLISLVAYIEPNKEEEKI